MYTIIKQTKAYIVFLKKKNMHCVFLPNYNRLTYDMIFLSIMIKVRQKRNIIIQVK